MENRLRKSILMSFLISVISTLIIGISSVFIVAYGFASAMDSSLDGRFTEGMLTVLFSWTMPVIDFLNLPGSASSLLFWVTLLWGIAIFLLGLLIICVKNIIRDLTTRSL